MNKTIPGYSREERENQIKELLENDLSKKREENRKMFSIHNKNGVVKPITDVLKTSIEEIDEKTKKLKSDIKEYQTEHFTKVYLQLRDKIVRYQMKLGKIDVTGHTDIEKDRIRLTDELNSFVNILASKTHPGGVPCDDCEVKTARV